MVEKSFKTLTGLKDFLYPKIKGEIMYKYQKETIELIKDTAERLEGITESRMSLKIGYMRDEFWKGNEWREESGDLYLEINKEDRFHLVDTDFIVGRMTQIDKDAYINIDSDVFLKLNEFISKIYDNKRKNQAFHEELNKQLNALNKTIEVIE